MCPNSYVHILHSCPLHPSSRLLKCLNSPHSRSAIEPEEVEKRPIHLLLHLKVEAKIYVLKSGQQVLILVYKRPSCLNQPDVILSLEIAPLKISENISNKTNCQVQQLTLYN